LGAGILIFSLLFILSGCTEIPHSTQTTKEAEQSKPSAENNLPAEEKSQGEVTDTKPQTQAIESATQTQSNSESEAKLPEVQNSESSQEGEVENELYKVVKVIDGDTISVDINGKIETLRLIGINTPETVDPRKPVECFGQEASNRAKELLSGQNVGLESDPTQGERDKYGRLLRYVFLEDSTNFNKLMIAEGYAYEYTYSTPYKYQAEFKQAQQEAEQNKRGLWADNACVANNSTTQSQQSQTTTENKTTPTTKPTPPPATTTTTAVCNCTSNTYNCPDFKTQKQAQACYDYCVSLGKGDIHKLDRDKDGVVCETLP